MTASSDAMTQHECRVHETRSYDAPRALLFKAWTEAEHLKQWWGPHGFTVSTCDVDLRVGGKLALCMRSPDGKDYWMRGIFQTISPPERLEYSVQADDEAGMQQIEGVVRVSFVERDGKTVMTLDTTMRGESESAAAMLAGMQEGWAGTLERLSAHIAQTNR